MPFAHPFLFFVPFSLKFMPIQEQVFTVPAKGDGSLALKQDVHEALNESG